MYKHSRFRFDWGFSLRCWEKWEPNQSIRVTNVIEMLLLWWSFGDLISTRSKFGLIEIVFTELWLVGAWISVGARARDQWHLFLNCIFLLLKVEKMMLINTVLQLSEKRWLKERRICAIDLLTKTLKPHHTTHREPICLI